MESHAYDNMNIQLEDQIQTKQQLLQTEIIDKNYDKTAFVNFCLNKKANGDDLNCWTWDELREIVDEFIGTLPQIQGKLVSGSTDGNVKPKKFVEEVPVETVEKLEKMNTEIDKKTFREKEIKCRKLEKTQLNGTDINIIIKNPKEMDKGVFGQNYIIYEVCTEPFGWVVSRRYSDFDWLRRLLIKLYPGYNVPPLPTKKIGNRRFDWDFIMKRMKFLELFIKSTCKNEAFKASEVLFGFLSYTDRDQFEAKMKEFTSFQPSPYVEDYKTLDAKVIISHDDGNEKYFININKYFKLQTQIMDKLNYNLRLYYNNINAAIDNWADVQKNFEILHILNTRVLMKQMITKSYEEIGFFFKNWRKITIKQNDIIKNHIKDFFKFVNLEGQAYSELILNREDLKVKYNSEVSKLNAKKEKLFSTGDITKFELNPDDPTVERDKVWRDKNYAFKHMCAKDNLHLKKISEQLGYVNKMNIFELKKMIKEYCVRFYDNLKNFDDVFYPSINDCIGTWMNLETFLRSCSLGTQAQAAAK